MWCLGARSAHWASWTAFACWWNALSCWDWLLLPSGITVAMRRWSQYSVVFRWVVNDKVNSTWMNAGTQGFSGRMLDCKEQINIINFTYFGSLMYTHISTQRHIPMQMCFYFFCYLSKEMFAAVWCLWIATSPHMLLLYSSWNSFN